MSLFDIDGWLISAPIKTVESAASNEAVSANIHKKNKKKIRKTQTHAVGDKFTRLEDETKKVSSEELQKMFMEQFGVNGERMGGEGEIKARKVKVEKEKVEEKSGEEEKEKTNKRKRQAVVDQDEEDQEPKQKTEEAVSAPLKTKPTDNKKTKDEPAKPAVKEPQQLPKPAAAPQVKLTPLQQKMKDKLAGSRFRWINEKLYTTSSDEATKLIKKQPELYQEYHEGFRQQVQSWPENPVDSYVARIKELSKSRMPPPKGLPKDKDGTTYIADMGCGDAELSRQVSTKYSKQAGRKGGRFGPKIVVHSFDLAKTNERVTVADVKHVPLPDDSVHIVVFCLSLMGTNFLDFIKEANRILKPRGQLWISEIKSRFSDAEGTDFVNAIKAHGFVHTETDASNQMFIRFDFFRPLSERKEARAIAEGEEGSSNKRKKLKFIEESEDEDEGTANGAPLLKPCLYKKR
ncbi:methyltransferase-domain-containing protein [Myxozyma melibiosi]|uniref:Ribosomal RNA-processing protein 8 n=1 Tax=Myxozyma melibiosi TaxID=54550 RepID=A0ABR1F4L1_9ASCO